MSFPNDINQLLVLLQASTQVEIVVRLLIAAVLGGCIGFERERLSWAAGLRTHMLVCVGSCLVMVVSAYGFQDLRTAGVNIDPTRMGAQVVSGIGFLGAGAIILRGEVVKGLTTAASLWAVAAVGLAVGSGLYIAASASTIIMLFILAWLKPLSEHYRNHGVTQLLVRADHGTITLATLEKILGQRVKKVRQIVSQHTPGEEDVDEVTISFNQLPQREWSAVIEQLKKAAVVREIREITG
jgi:putative Mg2+ transporter-C (MgtC) family protein